MEQLKPRHELLLPDIRYCNRIDLDHSTGEISETTIDSLYDIVESISLNRNVPESVQDHFQIARNLALYSWFVYSFNVVAAMQAFGSLEMAVKEKSGDQKTSLKNQLDKLFKGRQFTSAFGPSVDISEAVAWLRNDLAHGSTTIHGQGLSVLRTCAELINELFP